MTTGLHSAEIILKGIVLHDIVLSADEQITYCIADDNNIYEIKDNTVITYNLIFLQLYKQKQKIIWYTVHIRRDNIVSLMQICIL